MVDALAKAGIEIGDGIYPRPKGKGR